MQLNHYLNFNGTAESAFEFYRAIFGGEFAMLSRYGDLPNENSASLSDAEKNAILHISLPINAHTVLMASDINEQFCAQRNIPFTQGTNHYISINLDAHEQDEAHRLFDALSQNGAVEMPLEETFWGALYGAFTDQFCIQWMINCQLKNHVS